MKERSKTTKSRLRAATAGPPDQSVESSLAAAQAARPLALVALSIRWRDLDAFNHVNNSSFLTYIEEARLRWLQNVEGPWFSETCMPVVAATHVNYRAQLGWPGDILVRLHCARSGNSSLTLGHQIIAADDSQRLYADGDVVLVWIDPANGRPVTLPDAIRQACAGPVPPRDSAA
ncbi:MAG: thioesterase family protein [Rhodanobacteraceae bacterium]